MDHSNQTKPTVSGEARPVAAELLSTKLTLPPLRNPRLPRPELLRRLNAGLDLRLTLISAGAGFGKTSLASEWVRNLKDAQNIQDTHSLGESRPPVQAAWVSLDPGDNDPLRFWRYVFSALQPFAPEAGGRALELLQASTQPSYEAALTGMINALVGNPGRLLLVLEDYHFITNPAIHQEMAFLIEHLPAALHPVLVTRSDPPLPLARLRARSEISELRAADLSFSIEEIEAFLAQSVAHPLAEGAAACLLSRTEGWPAGVRLAALALQARPDPDAQASFLETFTGSHRPILEYLAEDVFASLPQPLQEFILSTCTLNRMSASLCDAITGRNDGLETLAELERLNLFVEPLDGAGVWYRYHPLFAEAMQHLAQQRLGAEALQRIARLASEWYEDHALQNSASLSDAVEAALNAGEHKRTARLIELSLTPRMAGNEFHTLLRWMQALPRETLSAHPALAMAHAKALLFTTDMRLPGAAERALASLELAEARWEAAGEQARLGEALAFRSLLAVRQGNYPAAFDLAQQALESLPEEGPPSGEAERSSLEWRAVCLNLAGWGNYFTGRLEPALQMFTLARDLFQAFRNPYGLSDVALALGEVHAARAEARQAAEYYRLVLAEDEANRLHGTELHRRAGMALAGLAELACAQNDLEQASSLAAQALEIASRTGSEELLAQATFLLARLQATRGEFEAALERMQALSARLKAPQPLFELQLWKAWLALSSGDLEAARRQLPTPGSPGPGLPFKLSERTALLRAQVHLASGEVEAALEILQSHLEGAREQGRALNELEFLVQMVVACLALGERREAIQALRFALALAQPQGYRRPFLEAGTPLLRLLGEIAPSLDGPAASWALSLLQEAGKAPPGPRSAGKRLSLSPFSNAPRGLSMGQESLSQQEERVFLLVAAGLSNPEIAQELFISVNTVKSHVKSIYRKLNLDSRRAVREAARRMTRPS